jgi:hypothetical protein
VTDFQAEAWLITKEDVRHVEVMMMEVRWALKGSVGKGLLREDSHGCLGF